LNIAAVATSIVVLFGGVFEMNVGWPLAGVALFFVFQVLSLLLHELGHLFGALAVGMRVFNVSIGEFGKVLLGTRILGIDFVFRTMPLMGHTLFAPKCTRYVRLRHFAVISCGPLVNALLMGLGVVALGHLADLDLPETLVMTSIFVALMAFILANVFMLIINLFPHMIHLSIGRKPNDGLALLSTPFMSSASVAQLHAARSCLEGLQSYERGDSQRAKEWLEEGLREYPNHLAISSVLGLVELDLRNYDQARRRFFDCMELAQNDQGAKALMQNNIAWADLMIGKPELLAEADYFSRLALAIVPWQLAIMGTRGSVLIELGRFDEGIELLDQAFDEDTTKKNKALNACYRALAMARKSDQVEAARLLAEACNLDADCPLISRVERELAERAVVG
jgi:hypothetical protein